MSTRRLPLQHCPKCGHKLDAATNAQKGIDNDPAPGDVTVCINCVAALQFGPNLVLAELTSEELAKMDIADKVDLLHARNVVRQINKMTPSFEELKAVRNYRVLQQMQKMAEEMDVALGSLKTTFDPNACYCACPDGPCEHTWDGPVVEHGSVSTATCSKCSASAFSHDMRVMP